MDDAIFKFADLGPIGFSILQEINQRYLDKLYASHVVTDIGCDIIIDKLEITHNFGCELIIKNACISNNELGLDLLVDSLYEVLLLMPDNERNEVLKILGVTMNDLENHDYNSGFLYDCVAYAQVHEGINIGTFKIDKCISNNISNTKILFVNSGSAAANCAISQISNGLKFKDSIKDTTEVPQFMDTIFGFDSHTIFMYVILIFLTGLVCCILVNVIKYFDTKMILVSRNDLNTLDKSFYIRPPVYLYHKMLNP